MIASATAHSLTSDYAGAVEEEENRFLAEGFAALRADIAGLIGGR